MKILAVLSGSIVSGKELIGISVLENLKTKKHEVVVLSNGWNDGRLASILQEKNIVHYTFKLGWYYLKKISWSLNSLVHLPGAWYKFYKILKKHKPDVIYIDSYRFVILLYPFIKLPVVFHVHDAHNHSIQDTFLIKKIEHKIYSFISISNFIKKDLEQCGIASSKIETVYNGVHIPKKDAYVDASNRSFFSIGIVGQVAIRKGHKDLINACAVLKNEIPIHIKIFGEGLQEVVNEIKELIEVQGLQNMVTWMGFIANKNDIYTNIDVLVALTHSNEPFGLIAAEAQAYCVPVIVANSGGLVEIVEDGVTGYIIPPQQPEILATKLMYLFKNPQLRKDMGNAGYTNVQNNFSEHLMNDRIESVLNKTIN